MADIESRLGELEAWRLRSIASTHVLKIMVHSLWVQVLTDRGTASPDEVRKMVDRFVVAIDAAEIPSEGNLTSAEADNARSHVRQYMRLLGDELVAAAADVHGTRKQPMPPVTKA